MSTSINTIGNSSVLAYSAIAKCDLIKVDTTNSTPTQLYAIPTAADTDEPLGVALADAAAGEPVQWVPIDGSIRVLRSAGSISVADYICPTSSGEAKTAASGDRECGLALTAGTTADDEFQAIVYHGHLRA